MAKIGWNKWVVFWVFKKPKPAAKDFAMSFPRNVKIGISPLSWTNDDLPELCGTIFCANVDLHLLFKRYGKRIRYVHLKDVREGVFNRVKKARLSFLQGVKLGLFTVPGDGSLNFDEVFSKLSELDYKGWLMVEAEQDPKKAPPLLFARKARDFILQKIGL